MAEIRVTVRNETDDGGLFLTPVWFGAHDGSGDFDLFDLGGTASEGLERLAEDGTLDTINSEFAAATGNDGVAGAVSGTVGVGGPIDPGETASATIEVDPAVERFLQFGSMVIPSNDAFIGSDDPIALFGADGTFLGEQTISITGDEVMDAGTEANTETDAAFLNQMAPNTGQTTNEATSLHEGFIGSQDGPAQGPNGEAGQILGGTTASGDVIDPVEGDFTQNPYELATVHINTVARHEGTNGKDEIIGGGEDDLVSAGNGKDEITTGAGWDEIFAGRGKDEIDAGSGDDIIAGGNGNDRITTGTGEDTIIFTEGGGRDTVTDFDAELDLIAIDAPSVDGFDDLSLSGSETAEVSFAGGTILLEGVDSANLSEDNFVFA